MSTPVQQPSYLLMSGDNLKKDGDANKFVGNYYLCLENKPEALHVYFQSKPMSSYFHYDKNLSFKQVQMKKGQKEIKQLIKQLRFKNAKVTRTIDKVQESNKHILIYVTGTLSNNSQPAREFKQMFTLRKSNSPASQVVLFSKFEYSDSEGAFATETNFHDEVWLWGNMAK